MNAMRTIQDVTGPSLTISMPSEFQGQKVEIAIRVVGNKALWGEGIKRCAGALADDPEWDASMDEIHQARKLERRPLVEDE